MNTKRRICRPGLTYKVRSRCIELRSMLKDDYSKDLMLQVLSWAQEKYNFELHAFDIMDTDFIFVIKTLNDGEIISRIMQYIKSQFARRFNRRHNRTGPFWNERFSDEVIDFLPEPEKAFFKILRSIAGKKSRYTCWCSKDLNVYMYPQQNIKKEVVAGIKIAHHRFFRLLGNSLKEQAEELMKMDYGLAFC